jgi:hypothetical protein
MTARIEVIERVRTMVFRVVVVSGVALGMTLYNMSVVAQGPIQSVQWSGSVKPGTPIRQGSKVTIELSGEIQDGWHVYGLSQAPDGPIPLRVTLDGNEVIKSAGAVSGTAPVKKYDPSLNVETESYSGSLALHLPAQVNDHPSPGKQVISVAIRFQACNDRVCLPPRTVHLSVPIEILPGS